MAGKKLDQDSLLGIKTYIDEKNALDEKLANKVTTLSSSSTDTQYPSAKVVWDNMQNIREVAEGKCNTYVLSYGSSISITKEYYSTHQDEKFLVYNTTTKEFEDKTSELLNGDYDNITIINNEFNSQNDFINHGGNFYILCSPVSFILNDEPVYAGTILIPNNDDLFKIGDLFYVIETDVPDRWVSANIGNTIFWDKLETSKVDLTQYYTKTESDSKYVALTGNQSIGGTKTFNNILKVANAITSTESIFYLGTQNIARIGMNSQTIFPVFTGTLSLGGSSNKWGDLYLNGIAYISTIEDTTSISFKINGVERFKLKGADAITGRLYPSIGNTFDIGTSSLKYKDLHLSGGFNTNASGYKLTLPDTSSFTSDKELGLAEGTLNVIDANDIVSNTLTQEQYDLITNGKPTRIVGTLLISGDPVVNSVLFNVQTFGNSSYGLLVFTNASGRSWIQQLTINNNTKKLSISSSSGLFRIGGLEAVNGKYIPVYPTTNTTPQYLQIGANGGSLSYNDPFVPTSVSISDGGTISDTTLQANIQYHRPIVLNGFTCYFSCDDGTNYQYVSTRYDATASKNHINVITINKTTWVATFHTSDIALS